MRKHEDKATTKVLVKESRASKEEIVEKYFQNYDSYTLTLWKGTLKEGNCYEANRKRGERQNPSLMNGDKWKTSQI